MTEPSDTPPPRNSEPSYRSCSACGGQVHASRACCPECGAYPGEEHAPSGDSKRNLILSLLLFLILLTALFLLSANRGEAAKREAEKFARIELDTERLARGPIPEARPTPVPEPTVTPVPTPTPIPFNPEDLKPKPKPTRVPRPRPTATPAPQPSATPVPEPTRPSTLDLKDQLAEQFRKELDEKVPMAKEGDYIRLTLLGNRSVSGTITRLDSSQLALRTSAGAQWVPFRQLSRESRMRVDKSERETLVEEKALEEVLKRLQN